MFDRSMVCGQYVEGVGPCPKEVVPGAVSCVDHISEDCAKPTYAST